MKLTYLILCLFIISCGIEEMIIPPDARERYEKTLDEIGLATWEKLSLEALNDSTFIKLPYHEMIITDTISEISAGYISEIDDGQNLIIECNTTSVLVDVHKFQSDSLVKLQAILNPDFLSDKYAIEIHEKAFYYIRIQPKLNIKERIEIKMRLEPIFQFPVTNGKNADIGSFWGDPRDGGKRKHKGIDIFAKKGTPLIAVTDSRVRTVRNKGLGGKQVWLNDFKRKLNIYYAHLDSQFVKAGQFVHQGDTIGTVGNTGNARTTPPHLHFGIYKSFSGAIDPLSYVKTQKQTASPPNAPEILAGSIIDVKSSKANLRSSPVQDNNVLATLTRGEKLRVIGISGNWFHVRDANGRAGYIYKSNLSLLS